MKSNQSTRRGFTQAVMLNSFQHLHLNQSSLKEEEILNQVQDDNRRGFTLIELLVVVLIIGILAAIAVPQYTKAVEKSRIAEAQLMLKSIYQAYQVRVLRDGLPPGAEYGDGWNDLFSKMDIELPGEIQTCPNDDPECVDSKYWRYHNEGSLGIFAFRLDGKFNDNEEGFSYFLELNFATGKVYCRNAEETTCTDLYGEDNHELN